VEEIATVWARALFEVSRDQGKMDEVREQLGQFADALDEDQSLQVYFFSPYFSTQEKKEGLHKAISGAEPIFMNTLEALVEKHRMPAVFRIRRYYDNLWQEENKLLPVRVTSAIELDQKTVREIGDRIAEQTGRKVELTSAVDPELLGGLQVRVGNTILDATVRHRLEQLRREVSRAA
jgi:F-type H+-transporting ATPase subunit delta